MASASALASSAYGLGLIQVQAFSAKRGIVTRSITIVGSGHSCPANLTTSFTHSRRAVAQSKQLSRINCIRPATDGLLLDIIPEEEENVEVSNLPAPTSSEIQSLLMEVCNETSIAELQLKVGSFKLRVKRDVGSSNVTATPAAAPALQTVPKKPIADSPPPASSAPAASKPKPKPKPNYSFNSMTVSLSKTASLFGGLGAAADDGLLFVTSPKVGVFKKTNGNGTGSKPLVAEGLVIKAGQVVCYLEQLGVSQPVETDISGEVISVLWEDGAPVGYADPLIAVRPAFTGIGSSRGRVMN